MKKTPEITRMTEEDIAEVHDVLYKTWIKTYPSKKHGVAIKHIRKIISPKITLTELKKTKVFIKKKSAYRCSFVLRNKSKITGFCSGYKNRKMALLRSLYVLPAYQGKGSGTLLWQHFKEWAGKRDIFVNVATYNKNAIRFYKKLGFIDTGKRFTEERFTFPDGVTIPQMEMHLPI